MNHQLQRTRGMKYLIEDVKTESGMRMVSMAPEVKECFQIILANRKRPRIKPMVNGYSGFLHLDKNRKPMVALHWEKYFQHIREKYNKTYRVQLPLVTPQVCRHTFEVIWQVRNESKDAAVHYFGNTECLYTCKI